MEQGVLVDRFGPIGLAIAAHVRRHCPESGLGQCDELMPPGVPKLRKPVAQQDERTGTRFGHMHPDAVRLDGAVRHFGRHGAPPSLQRCRKKLIIAALTSSARSCWVQWPQPGSMIVPRSCGTKFARLGISFSIPGKATTRSRSPAI